MSIMIPSPSIFLKSLTIGTVVAGADFFLGKPAQQQIQYAKFFAKQENQSVKHKYQGYLDENKIFLKSSFEGIFEKWEELTTKNFDQVKREWKWKAYFSVAVSQLTIAGYVYYPSAAFMVGTTGAIGIAALSLIPLVKKTISVALFYFKKEGARVTINKKYKEIKPFLSQVASYAMQALFAYAICQRCGLDLHAWKWAIGGLGVRYLAGRLLKRLNSYLAHQMETSIREINTSTNQASSNPWGSLLVTEDDYMWLLSKIIEVDKRVKELQDNRYVQFFELKEQFLLESSSRLTMETKSLLQLYLQRVPEKLFSGEWVKQTKLQSDIKTEGNGETRDATETEGNPENI